MPRIIYLMTPMSTSHF